MRKRSALGLVASLVLGCGSRVEPTAAAPEDARLAPCAAAATQLANRLRTFSDGAAAEALADRSLLHALACPGAYAQRGCGDAWAAVGDALTSSPAGFDRALRAVGATCAAAYCPTLPAPKPALCAPGASADIAAIEELDWKILRAERFTPRAAEATAARVRVFNQVAALLVPAARAIALPPTR